MQVESLGLRLRALDPLATLGRGFSIVQSPDTGQVITSTKQVSAGGTLDITVADGSFPAVAGSGIQGSSPKPSAATPETPKPKAKARTKANQTSGMAPLL